MSSHLTALFFALLLLFYSSPASAAELLERYCSFTSKPSAAARKNIARVLVSIETNAPLKGVATAKYGSGDNEVAYGLAQCRPDVGLEDCKACLKEASALLRSSCRGSPEGWAWYDKCFMRHDTKPFVGKVETSFGLYNNTEEFVTNDVAEQQRFNQVLGGLVDKVRVRAASKPRLGLGKAISTFPPNVTVNGLAQCTRDLPSTACSECIAYAFKFYPDLCPYRTGCRAVLPSCYLVYNTKPYFDL